MFSSPPKLIMQKIEGFLLAPSAVKKEEKIFSLSKLFFPQSNALDCTTLFTDVFKEQDQNQLLHLTDEIHSAIETTVKLVNWHIKKTMGIFTNHHEPSSYTILGILCVYFASTGKKLMYAPQYMVARTSQCGQNPSCDASIVMKVKDGMSTVKYVPRVIYECKPRFDESWESLEQINHKAVIESLIQANYCLRYHKVQSLVACLTDLISWHYYQVELSQDSSISMKIISYHKINHSVDLKERELIEHTSFLYQLLIE